MQVLSLDGPAERELARAVIETAKGWPECLMMLERLAYVNCKDAEV
jgi:hypothetical protein